MNWKFLKIELPQRIKDKSFLSEVWEVTARQFFPLKDPNQKSIFGGTLRQLYIFVFFPYFLIGFIFIGIYILILRLFQKNNMIKKFLCSDRFLVSLGVGLLGGYTTFCLTESIGWATVGIFIPAGLYSYFVCTDDFKQN